MAWETLLTIRTCWIHVTHLEEFCWSTVDAAVGEVSRGKLGLSGCTLQSDLNGLFRISPR
jgi:hypothetical protein